MPQEQRQLVDFLQQVIKNVHPEVTGRLAYGIPFFYLKKPLCYLNPKKNGVDVGFLQGQELSKSFMLITAKRKRVASLFFNWEDDVNLKYLQEVLKAAIALQGA